MKTLIVGDGEVGKGLYNVLSERYETFIKGPGDVDVNGIEIMHICFPYSKGFIKEVMRLKALYKPKRTVIHSTVPVGTTKRCGKNSVFSPIRGRHPELTEGIRTFTKYIAGPNLRRIKEYFENCGLVVKEFKNTDSLEYAKIMCTTRLGVDVCFMKLVADMCEKREYDFDEVYTDWNVSYNSGYHSLGDLKFWRPILKNISGKIGGHCVVQNCELENNWATKLIKEINSTL